MENTATIKATNVPVLSINKTVKLLSTSYLSLINAGASPKALPSVMLWGPPGVGKTLLAETAAENMNIPSKARYIHSFFCRLR